MTGKLTHKALSHHPDGQFPDPPPRDDMQNAIYLHKPSHQAALTRHFGNLETTLILSEIPVGWHPGTQQGLRVPDLLIAFNVDTATAIAQSGYSIQNQVKPPDFVLEVASPTTGQNDYTQNDYKSRRVDYAAYGIPEYWRFDPSGGRYHDAPLAGDILVNGAYQPVEVVQTGDANYRGHSPALNLDLCWEEGQLRWWDPAEERYLLTFDETDEARIAAEDRVRELEAELEHRQLS